MAEAEDPQHVWYFAYGSNMASSVLVRRRGVRPLSSERARLADHRLVFDLRGIPAVEPGFASIAPSPGDHVHGVLYRLTRADLARVDASEAPAYKSVDVEVDAAISGRVVASTLRNRRPVSGLKPSRRYLRLLCEGAREAGLPGDYVAWLEAQPTAYVPGMSEGLELLWGALFALLRRR
jgi:hypothetical protein